MKTITVNTLENLLISGFSPAGYLTPKSSDIYSDNENTQYSGQRFVLDGKNIVYRKAKITSDRPGAFLAIWQRTTAELNNKPVPLASTDLDYLFVHVDNNEHSTLPSDHQCLSGMFIFPVSLLIKKGIISSANKKGKTGFRVFPPWSQNRGTTGTKVFSASGKKTQKWQRPFFLTIEKQGRINTELLKQLLNNQ